MRVLSLHKAPHEGAQTQKGKVSRPEAGRHGEGWGRGGGGAHGWGERGCLL